MMKEFRIMDFGLRNLNPKSKIGNLKLLMEG